MVGDKFRGGHMPQDSPNLWSLWSQIIIYQRGRRYWKSSMASTRKRKKMLRNGWTHAYHQLLDKPKSRRLHDSDILPRCCRSNWKESQRSGTLVRKYWPLYTTMGATCGTLVRQLIAQDIPCAAHTLQFVSEFRIGVKCRPEERDCGGKSLSRTLQTFSGGFKRPNSQAGAT